MPSLSELAVISKAAPGTAVEPEQRRYMPLTNTGLIGGSAAAGLGAYALRGSKNLPERSAEAARRISQAANGAQAGVARAAAAPGSKRLKQKQVAAAQYKADNLRAAEGRAWRNVATAPQRAKWLRSRGVALAGVGAGAAGYGLYGKVRNRQNGYA